MPEHEAMKEARKAARHEEIEAKKALQAAEGAENAIETAQPAQPAQPAKPARGAKRKAPSGNAPSMQPKGTQHTDPKSGLNSGLSILIGRALTKGDISYTSEESNGLYVATLTVHSFEGQAQSFTGLEAGTKKLAEQSAAEATLHALQTQIDAKMPEHEAVKEARKAARQQEIEAKKAATWG